MKKIKRIETVTFELVDLKSDNGKTYKNLTMTEINNIVKNAISKRNDEITEICKIEDKRNEFKKFIVNKELLKKYSESDEIYPHFVYNHLSTWFTTSYKSGHCFNGGVWNFSNYDPNNGWHLEMIKNMQKANKVLERHDTVSVKDSVLIHFYSAGVLRMYGTESYFKTIQDFQSVKKRQEFFDYILDSEMVKINKKEPLTTLNPKHDKYKFLTTSYNTIGEAFLYHCIRNRDMDTLRYLVEKKGLDLYEIDKSPFELWTDEKPSEHVSPYFHLHLTTFLYRLLEELLMSNYDSSLEKCEKPDKYCKFFGEMFDYINLKFPDLKIKTTADKKTINKSDAISGVLKEAFGSHDYNEKQIKNIQKLFFK